MTLERTVLELAQKAKKASTSLLSLSTETKNNVLLEVADLLLSEKAFLQGENQKDLQAGKEKGLSTAMLDRLHLTDSVIDSMITGLKNW